MPDVVVPILSSEAYAVTLDPAATVDGETDCVPSVMIKSGKPDDGVFIQISKVGFAGGIEP